MQIITVHAITKGAPCTTMINFYANSGRSIKKPAIIDRERLIR